MILRICGIVASVAQKERVKPAEAKVP